MLCILYLIYIDIFLHIIVFIIKNLQHFIIKNKEEKNFCYYQYFVMLNYFPHGYPIYRSSDLNRRAPVCSVSHISGSKCKFVGVSCGLCCLSVGSGVSVPWSMLLYVRPCIKARFSSKTLSTFFDGKFAQRILWPSFWWKTLIV